MRQKRRIITKAAFFDSRQNTEKKENGIMQTIRKKNSYWIDGHGYWWGKNSNGESFFSRDKNEVIEFSSK